MSTQDFIEQLPEAMREAATLAVELGATIQGGALALRKDGAVVKFSLGRTPHDTESPAGYSHHFED